MHLSKKGQTLKKSKDYILALQEGLEDGTISPENLVFVDESGIKSSETTTYGWSLKGERLQGLEPKNTGRQITVVGAITLAGVIAAMWCSCTFAGDSYEAFLVHHLYSKLQPGNIVIMDNVPFHKTASVKEIIEAAGARVVFLPPYHPELNPIENMWSKFKNRLRRLIGDGVNFAKAIAMSLKEITEDDCEGWFDHCGYVI